MSCRSAPKPLTLLAALVLLGSGTVRAQQPPLKVGNFGFPVGFSVSKMDRSADPRRDFKRYAAGRWLDKATIPAENMRISSIDALVKLVKLQLQAIVDEASKTSLSAPKGSPVQQVGDFYASGMDEKHISELGLAPLQPELDRIAALEKREALAPLLAHLTVSTNDIILLGFLVTTDPQDRTRNALYFGDADLGMGLDNYLKPEAQPIRDGYKKYIADTLVLAGSPLEQAQATASKILEMETRIARKKLTPVQKKDPNKRFKKISWADLKSLASNLDVEAYTRALGLPAQAQVVVVDLEAVRERNALLAELPLSDTQAYLRWELLKRTSDYLSPPFQQPALAFKDAMYGKQAAPTWAQQAATQVPVMLGHPLSQIYVARYFSADTKRAVEDMVGRIKAEFRGRLVHNRWLSAETRRSALEKLDKAKITVGYPAHWIDHSSVDIRRDDYLGNVLRINRFRCARDLATLGQPVVIDEFAVPNQTLPVVINAAYQADKNSIEIPAAFLQPPFYDAKADVAVNFATMGAVIGHEITHGFDSQGRLYDAGGTVRDWWTADDAKKFNAETQKIVRQADAWQVLPGLHINGGLAVTENLADVGGVSLGWGALQGYLHDHPEANRKIDGFTPQQRYFLAWAQIWADKSKEGYLRQIVPTDSHPPGVYRLASPSQHEAGFFKTFSIRAGDPMWLADKDRAKIW